MPTVPRYDRPQVQQAPQPGVRVRAIPRPEFDLGPATQAIAQIVEEERQKADEIAFTKADAALSAVETDILYNPESGVLTRHGEAAFEAPEKAQEAWQTKVGEIEQGLTSDRAKRAFQRRVLARWESINGATQRHVASERAKYDAEQADAHVTNERNAAIASFDDPERVAQAIASHKAVIAGVARRQGWSPEVRQEEITKAVSGTHRAVLTRMLGSGKVGADIGAQSYYDAHQAEIAGADRVAVEGALQEGSIRGRSQRMADEIVSAAPDRATALDAVRNIEDPELRDATDERVTRYFAQQKQAEAEAIDDRYLSAVNLLDSKPGVPARDLIDPATWASFPQGIREALERRAQDRTNDDKAWLTFLALPPEEIASLSRSQFEARYWSRFDSSHRGRAESLWISARDAATKGEASPEFTQFLTNREMVENALRNAHLIDPDEPLAKLSAEQRKFYADFEQEAQRRLHEFEAAKGKRANADEVSQVVDDLTIQRVFAERGEQRIYRLPGDPTVNEAARAGQIRVPYSRMAISARSAIERNIRSRGGAPTTDQVERAYMAYLLGDQTLMLSILTERR